MRTRAVFSFSWVAGPPLAAFLMGLLGNRSVLWAIAGVALLGMMVTGAMIRERARATPVPITVDVPNDRLVDAFRRGGVPLLILALTLLMAAGSASVSALPLLVTQQLGLDVIWSGLALGVAAALRILPVLLSRDSTARSRRAAFSLRSAYRPIQNRCSAARLESGARRGCHRAPDAAARQQRKSLDRRVGEHPRVLAAAAALPRHDVAIGAGDARQAARHHAVVAVAVRDEKHAHHQRAAFEAVVVPDRRVRERQIFLDDVALGRTCASRSGHSRARMRRGSDRTPAPSRVGEGRLDHDFMRDGGAAIVERRGLAAPPGSAIATSSGSPNSRSSRSRGRNAAQRGRFEHAHAERVGHQHVPVRHACTRPGTPSAESARSSSGSQKSSSSRRRMA